MIKTTLAVIGALTLLIKAAEFYSTYVEGKYALKYAKAHPTA